MEHMENRMKNEKTHEKETKKEGWDGKSEAIVAFVELDADSIEIGTTEPVTPEDAAFVVDDGIVVEDKPA